jgi:hypothetical protein
MIEVLLLLALLMVSLELKIIEVALQQLLPPLSLP